MRTLLVVLLLAVMCVDYGGIIVCTQTYGAF